MNRKNILTLEIPGLPPTVNHSHMNAHGRRFRTKECREFQNFVVTLLKSRWGFKPYSGRAALEIVLMTDNHRRWDIDNRLKALQDCLTMAGIIRDDSQIDRILMTRIYGAENKTVLTLSKFEND